MVRQVGLQGAPFHDVQMKSKNIVTIGFKQFSNSNIERFAISKKPHRANLTEIVMMSIINHDLLVISEYRCELFNN